MPIRSALRTVFGPLTVDRTRRATWLFQRTDDAMSGLVIVLGVVAQTGWLLLPLWPFGPIGSLVALAVLLLSLRSGRLLRVGGGEVRAWHVYLGIPIPGPTRLRRPLRLEHRSWEQDFAVFLPVVAVVGAGGAIELRVQPGQEERLHHALEAALARRDLPPAAF